jgi:hypothetical protein
MGDLKQAATEFVWREDGPTAVEEAVTLALVTVVCLQQSPPSAGMRTTASAVSH